MTKINLISFYLILSCIISIITVSAKAQNVQRKSLRAPDNIKVDGKLNEWGKLQAKNGVDQIRYTISNNNSNLYLTIQALDVRSNSKIAHGGITFIISHSLDKRIREEATGNVSITFPIIDRTIASGINAKQRGYFDITKKEREKQKKEMDSLYNAVNLLISNSFKEIKVEGVKGMDTLISVYNDTGIKAVASFDRDMHYTYELAIPLKYLGLTINKPVKFSYSIKLNGPPSPVRRPSTTKNPNNRVTAVQLPMIDASRPIDPEAVYKNYPSSFWGEYILAQK